MEFLLGEADETVVYVGVLIICFAYLFLKNYPPFIKGFLAGFELLAIGLIAADAFYSYQPKFFSHKVYYILVFVLFVNFLIKLVFDALHSFVETHIKTILEKNFEKLTKLKFYEKDDKAQ